METLDFKFEVKQLTKRQLEGHASTFGNIDLGGDIVMPGAFSRTLAEHKQAGELPKMAWMHDLHQIAGRWDEMVEDERGLSVKGELADTPLGNELRTLLNMKAFRGLSIGFMTREADFDSAGNRRLKDIDLLEVSLVSLSMNPLAQVEAVKSRLSLDGEYVPTEREFEEWLHRDMRCSKTVACGMASRVFGTGAGGSPGSHRRESGVVDSEAEELKEIVDHLTGRLMVASLPR